MRIVTEPEFLARLSQVLTELPLISGVTGPGRSGAIAAVYASHALGVPFVPFGAAAPSRPGRMLIIDTARSSGRTLRKAARRYDNAVVRACYEETPRVAFWYERMAQERGVA